MPSPKSFFEIVLSQSHSAIGLWALSYVALLQPAESSQPCSVARLSPYQTRSVRRSEGVWSHRSTGGGGESGGGGGASGVSGTLLSPPHAAARRRTSEMSLFCMLPLSPFRA